MKAIDLDKKFDLGKEDILDAFNLKSGSRINHEQKRVNVDFPKWMVKSLDQESGRLGITRQSLIKMWIAEGYLIRYRSFYGYINHIITYYLHDPDLKLIF